MNIASYSQTAVKVLEVVFFFIVGTAAVVVSLHPVVMDFISYWGASVLALDGRAAAAYDVEIHRAVQEEVLEFEGRMPFAYPPPYLLVVLPFGLLPYASAASAWILLTFALYALTARGHWLAISFPPILYNALNGQNGMLTAAIFLFGTALLQRRPFTAGLVLGCLIVKPQLGLLLPIALAAGGQWRGFAGAAVSVVALSLLSTAAFGTGVWQAWASQAPLFASVVAEGLPGWHKLASTYAAIRSVGLSAAPAWAAHLLVAAAAAAITWATWRSDRPMGAKIAVLAAATALASPYFYHYDTVLLVAAFLWLWRLKENRPALALLWLLLLAGFIQIWSSDTLWNIGPLVPIALIWLTLREPAPRRNQTLEPAV